MTTPSTVTRAHKPIDRLTHLAMQTRRDAPEPTPTPEEVARFTDELLAPVERWCQAHADRVSECYVATHERLPAVYVYPANGSYDHTMFGLMAELEMDLHRRGWNCPVHQDVGAKATPEHAFLRLEEAIKVYPPAKGRADANGG